eukprot:TRINITY_DN8625_c1_g2_i3.p1 TRINITY_DN8625_c1_g2~~TRINITY_DN8625_c1_g2_i3.p1  ORF type:complete len:408 (+),score=57.30 TRINITY_DN8625_c1_g2_i3:145-1368(+)
MQATSKLYPSKQQKEQHERKRIIQIAIILSVVSYLCYYTICVICKPRLYFKKSPLSSHVSGYCRLLHRSYCPPLFLFNTHLQTLFGILRRFTCFGRYEREVVSTQDGGCVSLDWFKYKNWDDLKSDAPILLVLHGLTGSSREGYCKWMCYAAAKTARYRCVVMNYRGEGGMPLKTPMTYSATKTEDIRLVVSYIHRQYPDSKISIVGYSIGSLMLAKFLREVAEEEGEASLIPVIKCAALVSCPVCVHNSTHKLEEPWSLSFLYNFALTERLKMGVLKYQGLFNGKSIKWGDVKRSKSLKQFDSSFSGVVHSYDDVTDYYQDASSSEHLKKIRTPTLILVAEDDAFLGVLPISECYENSYLMLAVTRRGGHVSFLEGMWPLGQAWMERVILQYLDSMCKWDTASLIA